jgi:hypothetical protein
VLSDCSIQITPEGMISLLSCSLIYSICINMDEKLYLDALETLHGLMMGQEEQGL